MSEIKRVQLPWKEKFVVTDFIIKNHQDFGGMSYTEVSELILRKLGIACHPSTVGNIARTMKVTWDNSHKKKSFEKDVMKSDIEQLKQLVAHLYKEFDIKAP